MKKDTYYFSHDANARNDVKCIKLRRELGLEGYGIFWCLIEILREAPEHKLLLTALEDIAYDLHTSKEKIEAVVLRYDLFKLEEDRFFSLRLSRSMSLYNEHRQKLSESGKHGNEIRWGSGGDRQAIGGKSQLNKRKGNKRKEKYLPASPESVRPFYEKEVANNESQPLLDGYQKMIEYLYGKNPLKRPYENILRMKQQISYTQFVSMKEKSEDTSVTIKEILDAMENRSDLPAKNISASATAMNWMRRNQKAA